MTIGGAHTGYLLEGSEIVVARKRGRPKVYRNPLFVPQNKKIEACALYCVLGDVKKVSSTLVLREEDIRQWQTEPWWAEVQKKVMVEGNDKLLSTINNTIEQALAMLEDRILNGDVVKIGMQVDEQGIASAQLGRVPIKARDLSQIFHSLAHQRQLMLGNPTSITGSASTDDRLKLLSEHFKKFTEAKEIKGEVINTELSV